MLSSLVAATLTVETVNAQSSPVATLKVDIVGTAFSPPDIIVLKGSKVTWTNKDSTVHTVTASGGATRESIDDVYAPAAVGPAATGDHTFQNLGIVTYTCRVHASMKGSVTVVEKFDPVKVPIVNVTADDTNQFLPKIVALNVSQGVVWTNAGQNLHDVTFQDASIGSLGDLKAGTSLLLNFTKEGTYAYRCKYHSTDFTKGMIGHIGVGANATFPVLVLVNNPAPGSNVSGTVTIEGTTDAGFGRPDVDQVQVDFDRVGKWVNATGTDLWSYSWDTTAYPNAFHTIVVRALANGEELGKTELSVNVANDAAAGGSSGTGGNSTDDAGRDGSDTPAPGLFLSGIAVVWAARRRRA
jgi:plastocyanin